MVQARRQRSGEPSLRITIRRDKADRLLQNWRGSAEALAETLEPLDTCILTYPQELGLLRGTLTSGAAINLRVWLAYWKSFMAPRSI